MCRNNRKYKLNYEGIIGLSFIIFVIIAIIVIFHLSSEPISDDIRTYPEITTAELTTTSIKTTTTTTTATEKVFVINPDNSYEYNLSDFNFGEEEASLIELDFFYDNENEKIQTSINNAITNTAKTLMSSVPETKEITTTDKKLISHEDISLLAGVIEAEGGSIPKEARARIGAVVLNRMNSTLFPDSIYDICYSGDYSTVNSGLVPSSPEPENLELAKELVNIFSDPDDWYWYCLDIGISDKTVYQANSDVEMSDYAYKILDEYGTIESGYTWHMVYWESIYDYSDYGVYSEIHISPDAE